MEEDVPGKAFIKAWNRIVDGYGEYLPIWKEAIEGDDVLKAYMIKEIVKLVREDG